MLSSTTLNVTVVALVSCNKEMSSPSINPIRMNGRVTHHYGSDVNEEGPVCTRTLPVDLLEVGLKV
jgi:hypothetical protein